MSVEIKAIISKYEDTKNVPVLSEQQIKELLDYIVSLKSRLVAASVILEDNDYIDPDSIDFPCNKCSHGAILVSSTKHGFRGHYIQCPSCNGTSRITKEQYMRR